MTLNNLEITQLTTPYTETTRNIIWRQRRYIRAEETFMFDHAAEEQRCLNQAEQSRAPRRDGRPRRATRATKRQACVPAGEEATSAEEDLFVFRVHLCMNCGKKQDYVYHYDVEVGYCSNNGVEDIDYDDDSAIVTSCPQSTCESCSMKEQEAAQTSGLREYYLLKYC